MTPKPTNFPHKISIKGLSARGVTLIEILVVMVIISLLMAVGIKGISTMSTPRRQTAVAALKGTIDQARAHAAENRKYVAMMIVDGVSGMSSTEPGNLAKYAVFEVAKQETDGSYKIIDPAKQITEWKTLPDGIAFLKGLSNKPTILDLNIASNQSLFEIKGITTTGGGYPKADVSFTNAGAQTLPGIVFGPNGAVVAPRLNASVPNLDVLIVEGRVDATGGATKVTATSTPPRIEGVRLVRLTGLSRYYEDKP